MNDDKMVRLAKLYNRSAGLLKSLRGRPLNRRDRDVAARYNILRADVKRFVNDSNFDRIIPSAWCFKSFLHIPLALLILSIGVGLAYFLLILCLNSNSPRALMIFSIFLAGLVTLVAFASPRAIEWLNSNDWFLASTIEQVWDRADMLHKYVQDYIDLNPALASQLGPKGEQRLKSQIEALYDCVAELDGAVAERDLELKHLKELWTGLRTPSQYEVPQQVLDKLEPLERKRLLEAVQAYRVNAWTPAAAVCGIILEGRLQRLCHKNGIRPGGIGDMIQRLGEAGILKGYYEKLAQVGEFFRHRASHPTSEEFDREKTTLVLTSLIILVRDLF